MEALLKELSDIDHKLMRFGWGMRRSNAMNDEEAQRHIREAQDELSTEVEEETDSDEEEKRQEEREQVIRVTRDMIINRVQDIMRPWAERRNIPRERFLALVERIELTLWRIANGSLEDYANPETLRMRVAVIMQRASEAQRAAEARQGGN